MPPEGINEVEWGEMRERVRSTDQKIDLVLTQVTRINGRVGNLEQCKRAFIFLLIGALASNAGNAKALYSLFTTMFGAL